MRLFAILATGAFIAGFTVASAAPPPSGGATRAAYTNATCYLGFNPNPATYPALSQNVKYKCSATALCTAQFTGSKYSVNQTVFGYMCSRSGGELENLACATGFHETGKGYIAAGDKIWYTCATDAVTCPSGLSVTETATGPISEVGPLPTFSYACVSAGHL